MKSFKRTEKGTLKHKDRNWVILYRPSLRDDDGCFFVRQAWDSSGAQQDLSCRCVSQICGCRLRYFISCMRVCVRKCVFLVASRWNVLPWVMQNGNKKSCEGLRSSHELCVSCCCNIVRYVRQTGSADGEELCPVVKTFLGHHMWVSEAEERRWL
jgi:hypothetical protein